jgi:hypothetical protein
MRVEEVEYLNVGSEQHVSLEFLEQIGIDACGVEVRTIADGGSVTFAGRVPISKATAKLHGQKHNQKNFQSHMGLHMRICAV